jgi:hypothetical protein
MRYLFIIAFLYSTFSLQAQPADIISDLKAINREVVNTACSTGEGRLISNRALNLFIGYKVGTYLSNEHNFSFYKNNIIINTFDGTVAVNHNVFEAKGKDEPVKSVLFFGVKANVGDVFVKSVLNKKISNEFGINIKQTWIGRSKTFFNKCIGLSTSSSADVANGKQYMDAQRAIIVHMLEDEIIKRNADFEAALSAIDTVNEAPGLVAVRSVTRKKFYQGLKEEYSRKFAELQAATLEDSKSYNLVTTSWTSFDAYIPLATEKFTVGETITSSLQQKHPYTFAATLSHTRFWENRKIGRVMFTLGGGLKWNNSKRSYALNKVGLADYKSLGGTDTLHFIQLKEDEVYIGAYKNFINPTLSARFIYFPPEYHFGISFLIEQSFGSYNLLNGTLGVPIVLIDKKGLPSVALEFQFRFYDIGNKIKANYNYVQHNSVGLTVGIPLSKIIY